MLKLKTRIFVTDITIEKPLTQTFTVPLVFYMASTKDSRLFFITFVVLDFLKKQLMYIKTFFPENVTLLESDIDQDLFRIENWRYNPHRTLVTEEGESFVTFIETGKYFYHVNYKKGFVDVYSVKDFEKMTNQKIESFCCTPCKEGDFIYTTAVSTMQDVPKDLFFFKIDLSLKKVELLHKEEKFVGMVPHVTKKFGKYIFCSEFTRERLRFHEKIVSSLEVLEYVYEDLYKEFCELNRKIFSRDEFFKENRISVENLKLEKSFSDFVTSKGENFLKICENNPKYNFAAEQGLISMLDLENHQMQYFHTSTCTPAHFEIDEEDKFIYASSHNFVFLDKHYYLGPSVIDKFVLESGSLRKLKSFTTPSGFRFTTHKVFKFEGKSYLCTFGYPTGPFFIDTDTMDLLFFEDIEHQNLLPDGDNITDYINAHPELNRVTMKAIEVSDDGRYIILLSYGFIYFYDFKERKVLQKLRYQGNVPLDKDLNLIDFYQKTTHFDYLR
jgi:hypothetical protein